MHNRNMEFSAVRCSHGYHLRGFKRRITHRHEEGLPVILTLYIYLRIKGSMQLSISYSENSKRKLLLLSPCLWDFCRHLVELESFSQPLGSNVIFEQSNCIPGSTFDWVYLYIYFLYSHHFPALVSLYDCCNYDCDYSSHKRDSQSIQKCYASLAGINPSDRLSFNAVGAVPFK